MRECKKCTKCSIEKELTEFHKCSRNKSGVQPKCKICASEMARKRYEDKKDHILTVCKEYYKNNKEAHYTRCRDWVARNRVEFNKSRREWVKNNPEKIKVYIKRHQAASNAQTAKYKAAKIKACLLYTSPSPRDS